MAAATHLGGVVSRLRRMHPRRTAEDVVASFDEHDLLTYASAIAFNALFALVPLALAALGLLGLFDLESVWSQHVAPSVRAGTSSAVYHVLDDSVRRVLGSKSLFWATAGALLAVWEVSSAMRAAMSVLDRIYRVRTRRSRTGRYAVSVVLSAIVTVLVLLAAAVFELSGLAARAVLGDGAGVALAAAAVRWPLTAAALLAAVATVVRWAPADHRPWHWVSFGTGVVVVAWLVMSALFGLYVRDVADYGSIFGNLATVIVTFEYAYLSSIVFLAGAALDGRAQEEG